MAACTSPRNVRRRVTVQPKDQLDVWNSANLVDVISVTSADRAKMRSSGFATLLRHHLGLAPGIERDRDGGNSIGAGAPPAAAESMIRPADAQRQQVRGAGAG